MFQVHSVNANDEVVFNKPLRRSQVLPFFAKLAPCLVGMEACASAHYWARELKKLDHDVRLMPAKDVKAYVKRNKNDAAPSCSPTLRLPQGRFAYSFFAQGPPQTMRASLSPCMVSIGQRRSFAMSS